MISISAPVLQGALKEEVLLLEGINQSLRNELLVVVGGGLGWDGVGVGGSVGLTFLVMCLQALRFLECQVSAGLGQ